ncbi:hypothetical protein G7054_g879 [Neopestalotiopsis clavispora]|nr:hypothetical protein G7054_g879 [Neopestalotiopsis clavispora]
MVFWLVSLLCFLAVASAADTTEDCEGLNAISPRCISTEAPYRRDSFYVGGNYVPYNGTYQSLTIGQIYVEKLTPLSGVNQSNPLVFISAAIPPGSDGFTAPELANYYPQAAGHDKWPGTGLRGDPIFDAFEASMIPINSNSTSGELAMRAAGCRLLDLVGESFTFCHSASCQYTVLMSDECPELVKATINLEPTVIPFQTFVGGASDPNGRSRSRVYGLTNTPITYDPPIQSASELNPVEVGTDTPAMRSCFLQASNSTIHTLPQIAKVPFVMYTGSASPHITYDHCVALYLNQTQVPYEWIKLEDIGILGNGHFLYLETNNIEIADVVHAKLQELAD